MKSKSHSEENSTPIGALKSLLYRGSTKDALSSFMVMPIKGGHTADLTNPQKARQLEIAHFFQRVRRNYKAMPAVPTHEEALPKPLPIVEQPAVVLDDSPEANQPDSNQLLYLPVSKDMTVALHQYAWSGMNFVTVSGITSAAVLSVKSPIQTMVLTLMKESVLIPANVFGLYGCAKFLYAGTRSQMTGAAARTAYNTEAKDVKPADDTHVIRTAYVMGIAWGDLLLTQPSESLSTLNKARLLPANFNWKTPRNFSSLMMAGIGSRYCSGIVNLGGLCVSTDIMMGHIPGDRAMAAAIAGLGAGALAAIASHPFSALKDYTLLQSQFENGHLKNASSITILKRILKELKAQPKETLCLFFNKTTGKQVGLRMMNTALIFSILSGVTEFLGKEPLDKVIPGANPNRLFSSTSNQSAASIPLSAVEKQEKDQSSTLKH